ncbi:hypothetical protein EA462_00415 [Natrarchaeobius halalkaliphilus]|uniref:Uncharacterized protein n=1 Tax=Natrarchaeobius halalkaliphilus TaxID=1679091 RepID=A0A3N6MB92_9EURY|nr:hypothetical protein [Natrarchaeobius halalkaliphilus]RQG92731.1 hypothetical protein EA462_00415 [Natrarchaeobius halalkaliphilus]
MRRSIVVAVILFAIAFLFIGGPSLLFSPSADDVVPEEQSQEEPEIVSISDSESGFWPYLNAREAHEKRSPLNVVVRGESTEVVRLLAEHGDGDWEEADHDHFEAEDLLDLPDNESETEGTSTSNHTAGSDAADPEAETAVEQLRPVSPTDIPWSHADGATRLAYLDPGPGEETYWTTETLQLEDGEYYGYRYHIRLYESPNPDDQWVVMQTHSEHFDWFTLRHRVDGVEAAQSRLERDLMAIPGVDVQEDVRRIYLDNSGPADADGWATKVDLTAMAIVPFAFGLVARRQSTAEHAGVGIQERADDAIDSRISEHDRERVAAASDRIEANHLILAATIIAVVLGVRIAGIGLDRTVDALTVHMIAALLYPVIAIGLPAVTYAIANGLERRLDAAIAASLSLVVAIWLDYTLLGVDVLPIDVIVQRALVVVALGLIAGGAARRATRDSRLNDMLIAGMMLWILVLGGTLLGYL